MALTQEATPDLVLLAVGWSLVLISALTGPADAVLGVQRYSDGTPRKFRKLTTPPPARPAPPCRAPRPCGGEG